MRRSFAAFAAVLGLSAQEPRFSGLLQIWAIQALSPDLHLNAPATTNGHTYYDLSSAYTSDGLVLRRAQLQVAGTAPGLPALRYLVMADVAANTSSANAANSNAPYNPSLLQDAWAEYRTASGWSLRAGQFKPLQTYEGLVSPADLLFAERSQLGRRFADRRDRGLALAWSSGGLTAALGLFNGMSDLAAGKANDTNDLKDLAARIDYQRGAHHAGVYGLRGATDQPEAGLQAKSFLGPGAPSAKATLAHEDHTTNLGAFYVFELGPWHAEAEAITGQWGRRYPALGLQAGPASREALAQRFLAYAATLSRAVGAHRWSLRYDVLNANYGKTWTTAFDPYTESAPGVPRMANGTRVDFRPWYAELTAGWGCALDPEAPRRASLKVNWIHRSRTILAPRQGQEGAQGGDSLVAAFQCAF